MLKSIKEFVHGHKEEVIDECIRAGIILVVTTVGCCVAYKMGAKDATSREARKIFSDFGNTVWKTAIAYVEANGIEAAKTCYVDMVTSIG